jgi:hypothetical protein
LTPFCGMLSAREENMKKTIIFLLAGCSVFAASPNLGNGAVVFGNDTIRIVDLGENPDTISIGENYIDPGFRLEFNFDTTGHKIGVDVIEKFQRPISKSGTYKTEYIMNGYIDTVKIKNIFWFRALIVIDSPRTAVKPLVHQSAKPCPSKFAYLLNGRKTPRLIRANHLAPTRTVTR